MNAGIIVSVLSRKFHSLTRFRGGRNSRRCTSPVDFFHFYKKLVMDEGIKAVGDSDLFAFVEALGDGSGGGEEQFKSEANVQQQQQSRVWPPPPQQPESSAPPRSEIDACTSSSPSSSLRTAGIYAEITDAFDNWLTRLVDAGAHLNSARVFRGKGITETVHQMCADGLIGSHESLELRWIGNTWTQLLHYFTLYRTGCREHKRTIISCLLELFSSHLISEDLCVEVCAQL